MLASPIGSRATASPLLSLPTPAIRNPSRCCQHSPCHPVGQWRMHPSGHSLPAACSQRLSISSRHGWEKAAILTGPALTGPALTWLATAPSSRSLARQQSAVTVTARLQQSLPGETAPARRSNPSIPISSLRPPPSRTSQLRSTGRPLRATPRPVAELDPDAGLDELDLDWEDESEEEVGGGNEVEELMASWPRGEPLLKKKAVQSPGLANSDLWWNFQENDGGKPGWSAWQKRAPDADAALASAMAEIGQIKLHGDKPSVAEATLARTRKEALKRERLDLEEARKRDLGPLEYFREWADGWEGDSSKEAVQARAEAGTPLGYQIIELLSKQTRREYLQMQGTDPRIERDPLTMRMRDDQIEQVWGGDPVYPTVNYEQDPDLVIDYRGPNFHDPTPSIIELLRGDGRLVTREELEVILAEESAQAVEWSNGVDDLLSEAVDIGEKDDEDGDEEVELSEEDDTEALLPEL